MCIWHLVSSMLCQSSSSLKDNCLQFPPHSNFVLPTWKLLPTSRFCNCYCQLLLLLISHSVYFLLPTATAYATANFLIVQLLLMTKNINSKLSPGGHSGLIVTEVLSFRQNNAIFSVMTCFFFQFAWQRRGLWVALQNFLTKYWVIFKLRRTLCHRLVYQIIKAILTFNCG